MMNIPYILQILRLDQQGLQALRGQLPVTHPAHDHVCRAIDSLAEAELSMMEKAQGKGTSLRALRSKGDGLLDECQLCGDMFPLRDLAFSRTGQLLCRKCAD